MVYTTVAEMNGRNKIWCLPNKTKKNSRGWSDMNILLASIGESLMSAIAC